LGGVKTALDKLNSVYKGDLTINAEIKSSFLNNFAGYYERIEDYASSIAILEEALKIDKLTKDYLTCAIDYNNKAVLLLNMNNFNEAYECSQKALNLLEHKVLLNVNLDFRIYETKTQDRIKKRS